MKRRVEKKKGEGKGKGAGGGREKHCEKKRVELGICGS